MFLMQKRKKSNNVSFLMKVVFYLFGFFFSFVSSLSLNHVIIGSFDPPETDKCSSSLVLNWAAKSLGATHVSVSSRQNLTTEQVETIWKDCGMVPIIEIHANRKERERQAHAHHVPVPDLHQVLSNFVRAAEKAGHGPGDILWQAFQESDSAGAGFPWDLMEADTREATEAQILWGKHLDEALEETKPWTKMGVKLWARLGFSSFPHSLAERDVSAVLIERANDDVGDLLVAIAFARGSARQYGIETWGIDLSMWWGVISGCVGKLGPLYHMRHLYGLFAAGSEAVEIEGTDELFDSEGKVLELGESMVKFMEFSRKHGPSLGNTDVVVGMVIPHNWNGWLPPPSWATSSSQASSWNYARQRIRPAGMRSLDALFGYFFPAVGYAAFPWPFGKFEIESYPPASPCSLTNVVKEWAPHEWNIFAAEPPVPFGRFHTRKDARKFLSNTSAETSLYRPMADTRFGSIVDVLTDAVDHGVQENYDIVIVSGPVNVSSNFWNILKSFVEDGGIAVVSVGSVQPSSVGEELTGLSIGNEYRVGRSWTWVNNENNMKSTRFEPFTFVPSEIVRRFSVEVLAETISGSYPLITKYSNDNGGQVYTSLIPWFIGHPASGGQLLSGPVQMLVDQIIHPLLPSFVEGTFPVQWHTSSSFKEEAGKEKRLESRSVTLLNNEESEWNGRIEIRGFSSGEKVMCEDVRHEKIIPVEQKGEILVVEVRIPSFDVKIVKCSTM